MMLLRRIEKLIAGAATATTLTLGLIAATLPFSAPASAQASAPVSCKTPVTSAPSGPATVSATSSFYGKVLIIGGTGEFAGCSLYVLSSDEINTLSSGAIPFACSDNANPTGAPCDSALWPALLTDGAPIAGPGVNPALLGTVTRTDILSGTSVQQVTYAGLPLYRFFLDETPGETDGANLFDPLTSPTGIWYLVEPRRGEPAPGVAQLRLKIAPAGSSVQGQTVLEVSMDDHFAALPHGTFPVYTLRAADRPESGSGVPGCWGACAAVGWPPVLTSGRPQAGPGINPNALGVIVRPDGTHQVTYEGRPLYLYWGDAYIPGLPINGIPALNGAGLSTPWGTFEPVLFP